ncbi:MAG: hypothetical protein MRJ67_18975 [Nitrospirales bacterium]|nr:hypothetical protein [Nitrospira sp.]MDR4460818.1 hypothetical protein [Nitrospirales bacterium]MDR4462576.1 hypothetical protein [Nitrospirales bacterium]MDR4483329.1 hypothetical protein [Nitrospirales bacterium]
MVQQNRNIMAFVNVLAHPSSLRRKRRGTYPQVIQPQFLYESRIPGEPTGWVNDFHFVPDTPRMVMGGLTWAFSG